MPGCNKINKALGVAYNCARDTRLSKVYIGIQYTRLEPRQRKGKGQEMGKIKVV